MGKEIVKYHNDLNSISSMRGWTNAELNIFFGIIAKIRNKGTREIILDIDDLKEITEIPSHKNKKRWEDSVESVADKIASIKYYYRDENRRIIMNLFSYFDVDINNKQLTVAVTDRFEYIVNHFTSEFTTWELTEFTQLKSSYSKTMYRLVKQWKTVGKMKFTIDEFRIRFDIPKSYNQGMIKKRVIEYAVTELKPYISELKFKIIKSNKKGNPVIGYEFTWKPETTSKYNPNKYQKKKKKDELKPYWANKDNNVPKEVKTTEQQGNNEVSETELRDEINKMFKE